MRGRPLGWSPPLGLVHEGKWYGQGNERRWRCERCGYEWQWRPPFWRRCPVAYARVREERKS
jgi:rubrerythrin